MILMGVPPVIMIFEWDDEKSRSNQIKHGIDFDTARVLWDDGSRVEIQSPYPLESRSILIGKIDRKLWTAIFTRREGAVRIISVRRARKREAELYDQNKIG